MLAQGRFGTDRDGYRTMLALGRRFPQRTWAVEGRRIPTTASSRPLGRASS